jgi:acetyl-CoA C-acetyltransferase
MAAAIDGASRDAGSRFLVPAAEVLLIPHGLWPYVDPTPLILPRHRSIRSVIADVGVLQQTLISRACDLVSCGHADIVIVCGAETKYRSLHAAISGVAAPERHAGGDPGERLVPNGEIITAHEIQRGLPVPARQYAMIDTALRRHQGLDNDSHARLLGEMWSQFSEVAAENPDAWTRRHYSADELIHPSTTNPIVAWPYTKLHCSQWNVDQAAALIICSAAAAQRYDIPRDRWVFPHAGVQSNLMVPMTLRAQMHRSPAVAVAGQALLAHTGVAPADIAHRDLYSCFPAAVRVQQAEFGITDGRALTLTGGMSFAGGPFNSYTLHALAKMVEVLRGEPTEHGLVTNVSGMFTKFGVSQWSCTPPETPYRSFDVTDAARAVTPTTELDGGYCGAATTLTYTVAVDKTGPQMGIVIGESETGIRCLATTADPALMQDMLTSDWCDRSIDVAGAALLS